MPFASLVIALVMLAVEPWLVPEAEAVTHVMAKAQAGVLGGWYSRAKRDDITVLLIDSPSLERLGQPWPADYRTHARWLRNLAAKEKEDRPRAVFIDIIFGQARKDDTLGEMIEALCRLHELEVPVFLAATPDEDGHLRVREGLESLPGQPPCFTLVAVRYEPGAADRLVWNYPLWHEPEGHHAPGHGRQAVPVQRRSAALALAQVDPMSGLAGPLTRNMALTWGAERHDETMRNYAAWCRRPGPWWQELIPAGWRAALSDRHRLDPICPYHHALTMKEMAVSIEGPEPQTQQEIEAESRYVEERKASIRNRIAGRYVLIGADVDGYDDRVASPVQGPIPGVFLHAMALDNLLTYQGAYKRDIHWTLWPDLELIVIGVLTVLASSLAPAAVMVVWGRKWLAPLRDRVSRGWSHFRPLLRIEQPTAAPHSWFDWLVKVLVRFIRFVVVKALRVALSLLVILGAVVLAEKFTTVGIVPIVHLALFALVGELLGWSRTVVNALYLRPPANEDGHH